MSTQTPLTIAIANDHGGTCLVEPLREILMKNGHTVLTLGVCGSDTADYPDQAALVAEAILSGKADRGILICGSGIGISVAANKFPNIRATLCHDEYTARMSRMHNDSNILVMGGRTTGVETAKGMLNVWLETEFEGGRHTARIEKIEKHAVDAWKKYLNTNA